MSASVARRQRSCVLAIGAILGVGLLAGVASPARGAGSATTGCGSSGAPPQPRTVFVGVALSRPGGVAAGGMLFTPAHFRVIRYERGRGQMMVRVMTSLVWNEHDVLWPHNGFGAEGFYPQVGHRYRIAAYGRSNSGVIFMAPCDSGRLLH